MNKITRGAFSLFFEALLPTLFVILFSISIISMILLLVVGEWKFVILGILIAIIFPTLAGIILLPAFGLAMAGNALRKNIFLALIIMLPAIIYQQLIMVAYSFIVATNFAVSPHYILSILFGLFIVISPLTYMAKNDDGLGTIMNLLVAFVSYILLALFYLTGAMPIFLVCLAIVLIITIAIQGVAVFKTLKLVE